MDSRVANMAKSLKPCFGLDELLLCASIMRDFQFSALEAVKSSFEET